MSSVTWTQVHSRKHLISRKYYGVAGIQTITAPALAAYIRASMVGAGGWGAAAVKGYGAAFARVKTTCTPGEQFSAQVGDVVHTNASGVNSTADDTLGDSILKRVIGSVVICKAERGHNTAAGAVSNCVGDTKRAGGAPLVTQQCGTAAGDDADAFPLGFGGPGAVFGPGDYLTHSAAVPGGGGVYLPIDSVLSYPPGHGLICVEFFNRDPAISWPGY